MKKYRVGDLWISKTTQRIVRVTRDSNELFGVVVEVPDGRGWIKNGQEKTWTGSNFKPHLVTYEYVPTQEGDREDDI